MKISKSSDSVMRKQSSLIVWVMLIIYCTRVKQDGATALHLR